MIKKEHKENKKEEKKMYPTINGQEVSIAACETQKFWQNDEYEKIYKKYHQATPFIMIDKDDDFVFVKCENFITSIQKTKLSYI